MPVTRVTRASTSFGVGPRMGEDWHTAPTTRARRTLAPCRTPSPPGRRRRPSRAGPSCGAGSAWPASPRRPPPGPTGRRSRRGAGRTRGRRRRRRARRPDLRLRAGPARRRLHRLRGQPRPPRRSLLDLARLGARTDRRARRRVHRHRPPLAAPARGRARARARRPARPARHPPVSPRPLLPAGRTTCRGRGVRRVPPAPGGSRPRRPPDRPVHLPTGPDAPRASSTNAPPPTGSTACSAGTIRCSRAETEPVHGRGVRARPRPPQRDQHGDGVRQPRAALPTNASTSAAATTWSSPGSPPGCRPARSCRTPPSPRSHDARTGATGSGSAAHLPRHADVVVLCAPFAALRHVDLSGAGLSPAQASTASTSSGWAPTRRCCSSSTTGSPTSDGTRRRAGRAGSTTRGWTPGPPRWPSAGRGSVLTVYSGGQGRRVVRRHRARTVPPRPTSYVALSPRSAAPCRTCPRGTAAAPGSTPGCTTPTPTARTPPSSRASSPATGASSGRPEHRIHFAGEHTSQRALGFLDGAVESGRRAAREVLAGL